jgi:hypothetical protein
MAQPCWHVAIALAGSACLLLAGCGGNAGGNSAEANRQTAIALKLAGIAYGQYLASHGGAPPQDVAAFRKYVESKLGELQANGVTSAEDLLVSPRDGQPLIVVCGKRLTPPDQPDAPWAVYEATGVDGKRMIASARGAVVELSPEEFAQQAPGAA